MNRLYCFDTSGITTPLELMPYGLHEPMWRRFEAFLLTGAVAITKEIFEEMKLIDGFLGATIDRNEDLLVLDIGELGWDSFSYARNVDELRKKYEAFISEYQGGMRGTICLTDLSIIALAKTLQVPLVSSEAETTTPNSRKRRIPNICHTEQMVHLRFNDFLLQEELGNQI